MRRFAPVLIFLMAFVVHAAESQPHMIAIDPDNSHAAAVFARQIPDVSNVVHVYAPPGQGTTAFLDNLSAFNHRPQNPTNWQI